MVIFIFCCDNWGSEKLSHLPRIAQLVVSEPGCEPKTVSPQSLWTFTYHVATLCAKLRLVGVTEWNEPWGHLQALDIW